MPSFARQNYSIKYEGQAGKVGPLAVLGMSPIKSTEAFRTPILGENWHRKL